MLELIRRKWLCFAIFLIAASPVWTPGFAQIHLKTSAAGAVSSLVTPYVRAELVAHAPQGVGPGRPLTLGLLIEHQPDWHSYWKNPGDSGLPTQLDWRLPAGMDVGEIAWPVPKKIPLGSLANYGYEGRLLLPVPVTVSPAWQPGPLAKEVSIELHASWLVCRQECIPEEAQLRLQLPIEGTTALHASAFEAAQAALPQPFTPASGSQARVEGAELLLQVAGLPQGWRGQPLAIFPELAGLIDNAATPQQQWGADGRWQARLPLSPERAASPPALPLLLLLPQAAQASPPAGPPVGPPVGPPAGPQALQLTLPVPDGWPAGAVAASVSPALAAALAANAERAASGASPGAAQATPITAAPLATWLAALAGALLGGLMLNLMPCVFPVLAIKVAGFARHGQDLRAQRLGALAYAAGVLLSFLLLGGLMLALRAAGQAVGWGFQLQSPMVVAALALLFTLIALNLAGLFEFGHLLPSRLASLQARHPMADSFLTGVLAVAVASPCTAPFMGASLGLTASLPPAQALAIFAALGWGLALPYLLAAWLPAVARALPRPGAWMDMLRRLLAFPMLATVVWLVRVLGQQSGIDGAATLLALLLLLTLVVWTLTLPGRGRAILAPLSIALGAWLAWAWGPKIWELPAPPAWSAASAQADAAPGQWQPWQADLPARLLAQGRPVFIDYTAAWCVTCQYNKQTTLADAAVLQDFAAKGVTLLRADWTRRDPAITAALTALGRSGVPVYVLHAPGRAPVVFSEILGRSELRAALADL